MEERELDTKEKFGGQPLPGHTSDQNAEEAPADQSAEDAPRGGESGSGGDEGSRKPTDDPGSAKEGSQATGHPDNAG